MLLWLRRRPPVTRRPGPGFRSPPPLLPLLYPRCSGQVPPPRGGGRPTSPPPLLLPPAPFPLSPPPPIPLRRRGSGGAPVPSPAVGARRVAAENTRSAVTPVRRPAGSGRGCRARGRAVRGRGETLPVNFFWGILF